MSRTYSPGDLQAADPSSQWWALAWARLLSGDRPNEAGAYPLDSLDDAEWAAWLAATARNSADTIPGPIVGRYDPYGLAPVGVSGVSVTGYSYGAVFRPVPDGPPLYRPHEAAAAAILANPNWLTRETVAGFMTERRSAPEAAAGIRAAGAWIDRLIEQKFEVPEWQPEF